VNVLLMDPRVDPTAGSNHPLRFACANGHLEIVKRLLLDPRVSPEAGNNWAIKRASERGHTEVVKVLLMDPRVSPDDGNNYAIKMARKMAFGYIEIVNMLFMDPRVNGHLFDRFLVFGLGVEVVSEVGRLILELMLRLRYDELKPVVQPLVFTPFGHFDKSEVGLGS